MKKPTKRQVKTNFTIRITADQQRALKNKAKAFGMPVSELVRWKLFGSNI